MPKLHAVLHDEATEWARERLPWYAQGTRIVEWCSGQALWYDGGKAPLPLRGGLPRDPAGT